MCAISVKRTDAHTHRRRRRRTGYRYSLTPNRDGPLRWRLCRSLATEINTHAGDPISPRFWMIFAYKRMLGQTETRTRDMMYRQTIRTVRDISRDDRARIATCRLRTPTDRQRDRQTDLRRIIMYDGARTL